MRNEQARNKELTDQMRQLKQQFDAEKAAKDQAIAKLESELDVAKTELKTLEAKQAELEKAKRDGRGGHERHADQRHRLSQGAGRAADATSNRPRRTATPISRRWCG